MCLAVHDVTSANPGELVISLHPHFDLAPSLADPDSFESMLGVKLSQARSQIGSYMKLLQLSFLSWLFWNGL